MGATEQYKIKVTQSGLNGVNNGFDKMHDKVDKVGASIKKLAITMGGLAAAKKAFDFSVQAKNAARDAQEISSKFSTVFKDIEGDANKAFKSLADSYGLASSTAKELLGDVGDILTGLGFESEVALDLAEKVNRLSVDLASFTNYAGGAKGASQALTKALLGEAESVKALGIVIRQDTEEYNELVSSIMEVNKIGLVQAKALAALEIATKQSKNAIGDYVRTQDQLANVERRRKEAAKALREEIGNKLTPAFTTANEVLRDFFLTLTETSLETAVRQLREMGVEAEKLVTLQSTIRFEEAFSTLEKSTKDIRKEIGELQFEMGNTLFAENYNSIMEKLGQSLDGTKRVIDATKVSSENVKEVIKSLSKEVTGLIGNEDNLTKLEKAKISRYSVVIGQLSELYEATVRREGSLKTLNTTEEENNKTTTKAVENAQALVRSYGDLIPITETLIDLGLETPFNVPKEEKDEFTQWLDEINNGIDEMVEGVAVVNNTPLFTNSEMDKIEGLSRFTNQISSNLAQSVIYGQDFGNAMVNSLKAIAAEMASKAALFALLSLISGGSGGLAAAAGKKVSGGFAAFAFGLEKGGYPQEPKYMSNGGLVSFMPKKRDTVPAMLDPRERVLTSQDQSFLTDFLKGRETANGGSSMTINIDTVIGTEDFVRNQLVPIIQEDSTNNYNQIMVKS